MNEIKLKYRYKNEIFNSSWELAYWIYCMDHDIDINKGILSHKKFNRENIKNILKYIYHKYGKNYLNSFKDKKASDFKRDIIEADVPDLEKYKNKNVRFHYKCNECGKDVFATYHILTHFNDRLCKQCRKLMNKKEDTN